MQALKQLPDDVAAARRARAAWAEGDGIPDIDLSDDAFEGIMALLGESAAVVEDWTVYATQVPAAALAELEQHGLIEHQTGRWGWAGHRPQHTERHQITWRGRNYLWWWGALG